MYCVSVLCSRGIHPRLLRNPPTQVRVPLSILPVWMTFGDPAKDNVGMYARGRAHNIAVMVRPINSLYKIVKPFRNSPLGDLGFSIDPVTLLLLTEAKSIHREEYSAEFAR
ncbi:uncharacterized protein LOC129747603 [Uranotaenia lowii]|uniref:uncharacterized protein LOC129747603 n=1 Tax=Uranotaenia lowii TaxID=190385 RepID=UPI00247B21F7|nr:uncharacterized protein LOC129747603 [Uranotaenia lowii]